MNMKRLMAAAAAVGLLATPLTGWTQTPISEDFTGTTTTNSWYFFNGACLTAGTSTTVPPNPGQIPSCASIASSYYNQNLVGGANGVSGSAATLPDPDGSGALRFTNGAPYGYSQNGAIVSNITFPTGQGVQVTFKTVTYRGDSGGGGGDGADGISFYLMDGSQAPGIGAWGGSLGYSCSNSNPPYNGLVGGYLGLGVDEYGNFLNQGDNTATGYGYVPGRIGLRGAGSISWSWLNASYPTYYPSTLSASNRQAATRKTCQTGYLWDYSHDPSDPDQVRSNGNPVSVLDYAAIPNANSVLAAGLRIANESALKRGDATPIFYKLKITQDGLLSFAYSFSGSAYTQVITARSITASNGSLPTLLRFGFAGSTGGSTNIHEIMCFKAAAADQSSSSTGVNERQSAKIETGTQAYFAYYDPNNWTGRLTANGLGLDSSGAVTVNSVPYWDASCVLTGVAASSTCASTAVAGPTAAQDPTSRVILSWNGSQGIPLLWSNLTSAQQSALDSGDPTPINQNRLNYLRGDRSNEINSAGVGSFRARRSVLADIVDSSPIWVGPPNISGYLATFQDRLYPTAAAPENTGTQSYKGYVTAAQTRLNVVYAGANDGLLHGFRTGSFDSSGAFVNNALTPNDGHEVLAYMPGAVLSKIHSSTDTSIDYANTQYAHAFYVDGTPGSGDLFYNGQWHSWLVGGLGPGGAAIYALDATDPSSTGFTQSNAANLVIGEWAAGQDSDAGALKCTNVSNCGRNLGNTYGIPAIRRFHNGTWGAVFGNGYGSSTGDAGIYVMLVDSAGAKTFIYLSTGNSGNNDGIAYVATADLDGDHVTDYVYAGDLLGNLWRFDLTSNTPATWAASASPLFKTSAGQPITSQLVVGSGFTAQGAQRLMVAFGTGRKIPITNTTPVSYASGTQDLYGVWDWNMSSWNALSTTQYATLAATGAATGLSAPYTIAPANLQPQTITISAGTNRDIATNAAVCWQGSTECTSGNSKFGWRFDLPGSSEQIVFNPQLIGQAFVVNSSVPANNIPTSCAVNTDAGFTYAVQLLNGGAFTDAFPQFHDTAAVGTQTDAVGSSFPVSTANGSLYLVYQTVLNTHGVTQLKLPNNTKTNRLTWIQLR